MAKLSIPHYIDNHNKDLGFISFRVSQMKKWNRLLRAALVEDDKVADHCQIVTLHGHSLIVIADNAQWALRFRFYIPQLIQTLKKEAEFAQLRSIHCKIRPTYSPPINQRKVTFKQPTLSHASAQSLKSAAKKIQNEKLKAILEKIASYGNK